MRNLVDLVELADLVDILLVATLVYTAVVWVRRTQAGFVAIGLFVLAGLYVLAEALDLQLTTAIFRSFFAISVVLIVVLFQEELRQLFERLGVWSVRGRRAQQVARSLPADILVETLTELARQRRRRARGAAGTPAGGAPRARRGAARRARQRAAAREPVRPALAGTRRRRHPRGRPGDAVRRASAAVDELPGARRASARGTARRSGSPSSPTRSAWWSPRSAARSRWHATDSCAASPIRAS